MQRPLRSAYDQQGGLPELNRVRMTIVSLSHVVIVSSDAGIAVSA